MGLTSAAWVVTADIEKFFDNVEHRVLADQLRNIGVDDRGIRLVVKWLLAPADDRGRWYQPVKGLPQGSPVAPVLANLYLTGFDAALEGEGLAHVRYADAHEEGWPRIATTLPSQNVSLEERKD